MPISAVTPGMTPTFPAAFPGASVAPGQAPRGTPVHRAPDGAEGRGEGRQDKPESPAAPKEGEAENAGPPKRAADLPPEEQREVRKLAQRDQEVRAHEQAHKAAGGRYVRGAVSFDYDRGPDGRQYAVGGEVSISTSRERDPESTLRKAETIRAAAMAPANPSAKDHQVAAKAAQMAAEARREIAQREATAAEPAESGSAEPSSKPGTAPHTEAVSPRTATAFSAYA